MSHCECVKNLCVILFQYWLDHLSSFVSFSFHIRWIFDNIGLFVRVYSVFLLLLSLLCLPLKWTITLRVRFFVSFQLLTWEILTHSDLKIGIEKKKLKRTTGDCRWQYAICFLCFLFLLVLINRCHSFLRTTVFVLNRISSENQRTGEHEIIKNEIMWSPNMRIDRYISCLTYFRVDKINKIEQN